MPQKHRLFESLCHKETILLVGPRLIPKVKFMIKYHYVSEKLYIRCSYVYTLLEYDVILEI